MITPRNMYLEFAKIHFQATGFSRAEFHFGSFYTENRDWLRAKFIWQNRAMKNELLSINAEIRSVAVWTRCMDLVEDCDNLVRFTKVAGSAEKVPTISDKAGRPKLDWRQRQDNKNAYNREYYAKRKGRDKDLCNTRHASEAGGEA